MNKINRRTKRGKLEHALEREIERLYYRLADGVQVNIMDIPKIFSDAKIEHSAGVAVVDSLPGIIERYRVN